MRAASDAADAGRPGFRPDIEGLRAIAILLVVACHAGVPALAGGFVGVDVFFVISGYLITRLLVHERQSTGRIDFLRFYARRVRRLVPALVLVLVATGIAAILLLAPVEQADQARALASAALWISNFHFALADLDYFGAEASSNVALHTWSLGVEEQFYLVWPFWLLMLLGGWRWQSARRRGALAGSLAVSLLPALLVAALLAHASARLGFYMMPARFWQFTCGAVVHAVLDGRTAPGHRRALATACGVGGLALVVTAALAIDAGTAYPGPWMLVPTLGAALLIAAGSLLPDNALTRLIGVKPLAWLGRVSYGWYLWHWPVLVLGGTLYAVTTPALRLLLVAMSLLLATLSLYAVEAPIRRLMGTRRQQAQSILLGVLALVAVAFAARAWERQARRWAASADQAAIAAARDDLPFVYAAGCDDWYASDRVVPCMFGDGAPRHVALIFGDSVALQWFPAFQQVFDRPGWRLVVLTKSSCPAADIEFVYARIGRRYDECTRWRRAALDYVRGQLKPDIVVIGSSAAYDFDRAQWTRGTREVLAKLTVAAPHVYVMRPTPLLGFDGLACVARSAWRSNGRPGAQTCATTAQPSTAFDGIADAVAAYPSVRVVDLGADVCPRGVCAAMRGSVITYRDGQHLTATFARSLAPSLARQLTPAIQQVESDASRR